MLLFFMLSGHLASAANIQAVTGQLKLRATIHGEPAFKPVVWQLKRLSAAGGIDTIVERRHSAVVDLTAGTYRITATLNNVSKTQDIIIQEGGKHELTINLW
ncbi:MAG: hypothetical protein R3E89_13665 [Thiolinea sp.]